jgi:hypothetical protein
MEGQHQNPDEAVEGMVLSNAAFVAGHHWGTVKLTDEAIEDPLIALAAALDVRGLDHARFRPMRPGEQFEVPAL